MLAVPALHCMPEIGRGRVNCLGRSADPGYKGNSRSLAETAPDALT